MANQTSQNDLVRVTEQRDQLAFALLDAISIIEAQDDPDCAAWLGQARAALAKVSHDQQ
jgi:hypothetical protein